MFFVTFLPGFVPHGHSVGLTTLLFGGIFIVETALYWVLLLAVAARVTRWMNEPRTRRRLDTATGGGPHRVRHPAGRRVLTARHRHSALA